MLLPRGRLKRPGLSLMEVLVSLAIFLMSLAVLGQLIGMASDQAVEIQQRSLAGAAMILHQHQRTQLQQRVVLG